MNVKDLTIFREKVNEIIKNRTDINKLLDDEQVLKFARLIKASTEKKPLEDIRGIITEVLPGFKVKRSNKIYVCIEAYDEDSRSPVTYPSKPSTQNVDYKSYKDIETQRVVTAGGWGSQIGIIEFESSNTVLNPFDAMKDDPKHRENGYEEVRLDFFETCYRESQSEAIAKLKAKYPPIGRRPRRF